MSERYTRLYSLPENQYALGAPLLIVAGALLKDNQKQKTLAQLKFRNLSNKKISAVKIVIDAFDISGKVLEGVVEYQYLDLNIARGNAFGQKQAVALPNAVTRSFTAKCTEVVFSDGTAWKAAEDARWNALPAQETIEKRLGRLSAQYRRDTSTLAKYALLECDDLWLCTCGAINHKEEIECYCCNSRKMKLQEAMESEGLQQRNADYEKAEAEKIEKKVAEDKARYAKIRKAGLITVLIVLLILIATMLIQNVFIPNGQYNDALALMEAGQYTEAIAAFNAMDGYRDSANMIDECNMAIRDGEYNNAIALMETGRYTEAIAAFEAMDGYRDSVWKIDECNTAIIDGKYGDIYNNAIALMEAGQYIEAIAAFESTDGYKDSETKINECNIAILDGRYNDAIALMNAGNVVDAYETLIALNGYKDSADKAVSIYDKYKVEKLKTASVGDYVFFGAYEQDNNTSNGNEDIEWLVLDVIDGKALVISKYALDCREYDPVRSLYGCTWEDCSLSRWLNDDFLNAAFTDAEKTLIPTVTVSADRNNVYYSVDPGDDTKNKVFLLSISEVFKYFRTNSASQCTATDYAVANGVYTFSDHDNCCYWWLRSPGRYDSQVAMVCSNGEVSFGGYSVNLACAVRPAMWINLDAYNI